MLKVADVNDFLEDYYAKLQKPNCEEQLFDAFYADPPYGITNSSWDSVNSEQMSSYARNTLRCGRIGAVSAICTTFTQLHDWQTAHSGATIVRDGKKLNWKVLHVPLLCVDDTPRRLFRPSGQVYQEFKCITDVVAFFIIQVDGKTENMNLSFERTLRKKGYLNVANEKEYD